jgi:hypothetical protein
MLQRHNLRLGDGTVLKVDQDGLHAWEADAKAAVQVAGTQEWRPLREFLAEQQSAARLARALVPPEPRRAPAPPPPEVPPPTPPVELSIGAPPMVQALAEEPTAPRIPAPPWRDPSPAADEAPIIRLKPLDDEPPAPYGVPRTQADDDEEQDQERRYDRLDGPLLQVISTFGSLLSRCLDPLTPLVRGLPSTSAQTPAPRRIAAVSQWANPTTPPAVAAPPGLSSRVSAWVAGLTGWVGRLEGRVRPEPFVRPNEPAPKRPPAPAPHAPLAAPLPPSDLPVLRFADDHEPEEAEDVYAVERAEGPLPVLWLWTKRIVLIGGLVAGGAIAALNWERWFPRAAELGQTVFTEIDRQARSGQRAEEQQQALREATERLPHLAPETIRLVLSATDRGILEPPEVFQLATEAADRGLHALTAADAAELRALQRELLGNLRPPERARVAEYDRARARRVVFPFENPHALELVARGARAMPPRSRERLQTLLGQAVAAGLGIPAASPGAGPTAAGVTP